eukprot:m.54168 g.54168  ORF g.54168 m.54168 type:complete len:863 (+) comp11397_c1_seq1:130-2718(+)
MVWWSRGLQVVPRVARCVGYLHGSVEPARSKVLLMRYGQRFGGFHRLHTSARALSQRTEENSNGSNSEALDEPFVSFMPESQPPSISGDDASAMEMEEVDHLHSGTLWLGNLFPIQLGLWDIRHLVFNKMRVKRHLEQVIDHLQDKYSIAIDDVDTRPKEGGAFVRFHCSMKYDAKSVAERLHRSLQEDEVKSWLVTKRTHPKLVRGSPFVHDMRTFPTHVIKVTFKGEPLSAEKLYREFRDYGRIARIDTTGLKDDEPNVKVVYHQASSAISAVQCLHNTKTQGTKLRVEYFKQRSNSLLGVSSTALRFLLPALISLALLMLYNMFDPIRVFFITNKITGRFSVHTHPIASFLQSVIPVSTSPASLQGAGEQADGETGWMFPFFQDLRQELETRGRIILHAVQDVFGLTDPTRFPPTWSQQSKQQLEFALANHRDLIIIAGHKNCGRTTMVSEATAGEEMVISIDFRNIDAFSTEDDILRVFQDAVGYTPTLNTIRALRVAMEEFVAMSSRGVIAPTLSAQSHLRKVLECITKALASIKAHHETNEIDHRPLFVFKGMDDVFCADHPSFSEQLLKWVSSVAESQLARIIITTDHNVAKTIEDGLGISTVSPVMIEMHDASVSKTKTLLLESLGAQEPATFERIVETIGGRLSDLHDFVERAHQVGVEQALEDMLSQATQFCRMTALGIGGSGALLWTRAQAWSLILQLVGGPISYDSVIRGPLFQGDEKAIREMQRKGVIMLYTKKAKNGQPEATFIDVARPIFRKAMQVLLNNHDLCLWMQREVERKLYECDQQFLLDTEAELETLYKLMDSAQASQEDIQALGIRASQLSRRIAQRSSELRELEASYETPTTASISVSS